MPDKDYHDNPWLSGEQVMELEGKSERWVRKHAGELGVRYNGARTWNGKPVPFYDVSCLSAEAQLRWARQKKVVRICDEQENADSAAQLALDLTVPAGCNLSAEDLTVAEERYRVIAPLVAPRRYPGIWAGRVKDQVVELLASRHTRTLKMTGKKVPLSKRTIYNWLRRWKGEEDFAEGKGLAALVDRDRRDKGRPRKFNTAGLDLMVKLLTPKPGPSGYGEMAVMEAFSAYQEERRRRGEVAGQVLENGDARRLRNYIDSEGRLLPEAQLGPVSYPTFRRWVERLPKPLLTLGRKGREAFDNTEVPYSYRNLAKLAPLDWVVMDHRQLDLFCLVRAPKGWKVIRPWVTAALDMRTRRWLSWVIVEQPNSRSIATVIKRLLLEHGRPESFYWDNGQDFECDWLNGVMESLGIKVTHSIVKRARSKIIEPNLRRLANFERQTPWWTGHKADERPARLEALVKQHKRWVQEQDIERPFKTLGEIAGLYDQLFGDLNRRAHTSGAGMEKVTPEGNAFMSPDEAWNSMIGDVIRGAIGRDTLLFMFRERRQVKVRHSQVKLSYHGKGFIYNPSADDDPLSLAPFNGKTVEVAIDGLDLETIAVFYEGRLVCFGDNMELRGMREEAFKEDEKVRRRMYRCFKDLVLAVHEQVDVPTPIEELEQRDREAPREPEPERREVQIAYPETRVAAEMRAGGGFSFAASDVSLNSYEAAEDDGDRFDIHDQGDE